MPELEKSSKCGHFEGSEMSSKVRDFLRQKIATQVRDLRPKMSSKCVIFGKNVCSFFQLCLESALNCKIPSKIFFKTMSFHIKFS